MNPSSLNSSLIDFMVGLAPHIHYISFLLLVLAGLNLPVSEDMVFIISASIAATMVPGNAPLIFAGCFTGAYLGDMISYGIGRFAGRKVLDTPFFRKRVPESRIERVEGYFERYGSKTLFFGRFIPFGVRNIVFMSAGIGRMSPIRFCIVDFCALCITSSILFFLGYGFGRDIVILFAYLEKYRIVMFLVFIFTLLFFLVRRIILSSKKGDSRRSGDPAVPESSPGSVALPVKDDR